MAQSATNAAGTMYLDTGGVFSRDSICSTNRKSPLGCGDYRYAHWMVISADRWSDHVRLSDLSLLVRSERSGRGDRKEGEDNESRSICIEGVGEKDADANKYKK